MRDQTMTSTLCSECWHLLREHSPNVGCLHALRDDDGWSMCPCAVRGEEGAR